MALKETLSFMNIRSLTLGWWNTVRCTHKNSAFQALKRSCGLWLQTG